jgi:hypothetical protein
MKLRFILIFWVLLFIQSFSIGQKIVQTYPNVVQNGDFLINAGISLGHYKTSTYTSAYRMGVIPELSLSVEYALNDELSIGPIASHYSRSYKFDDGYETYIFKANRFFVGGRASYHFGKFLEKNLLTNFDSEVMDLYVTLAAGYKGTYFVDSRVQKGNTGIVTGAALLGMRYMFFENFGLFIEGGYGPFAVITLGLAMRF